MVISALNQSFSFHSSPESFISSRIQDLALSDPGLLPSAAGHNKIVVASILNRKVHIVSSYQLCRDMLESSSSGPPRSRLAACTITGGLSDEDGSQRPLDADSIVAGPAYHQLMSDFFPPPNLLLEDGPAHATHKQAWRSQLSTFPSDITPSIRQIADKHVSLLYHPATGGADGKIDLYDMLKSLAWEVLLGVFLDLSPTSSPEKFSQIESLHETLLRGQFSLFPVSINAKLWQSSRSKGIKARKELQVKLRDIVCSQEASCPFAKQGKVSKDDAANHALLFTSSLAVKALASLLTAFALNLLLWRDSDHDSRVEDGGGSNDRGRDSTTSLAALIRSQGDPGPRTRMLRSILLETERLSPPVVGVMRRVQRDMLLHPGEGSTTDHAVPAGHDIWLYLSGAARDPTIFGDDAGLFRFDRYMSSSASSTDATHTISSSFPHHDLNSSDVGIPSGFAFGTGPKACLGIDIVRQIILTVGEVMVDSGLEMDGKVGDRGVRGWLGWEDGVGAEHVAKGMKQLPVQRPRVGLRVGVRRVERGW
jgi:cytochrome P450